MERKREEEDNEKGGYPISGKKRIRKKKGLWGKEEREGRGDLKRNKFGSPKKVRETKKK